MKRVLKLSFIVCLLMFSCEELDEALEEIENQNTGSSNNCHIPWVGKWRGTSSSENHSTGQSCDPPIELKITFNTNDSELYVQSVRNSSACIWIEGWGKGNCNTNSFNGFYQGSVRYEVSISRSGSSISGLLKEYKIDSNGNKNIFKTHSFTVTKQ